MLDFIHYINKWIKKRVDRDGYYAYQCTDWAKQYANDNGLPITTYGNAIDLWKKGLGPNWIRVPNFQHNFPSAGDIVIFSGPTKYGHICVADLHCNDTDLRVIEQNAGSGNGDGKGENAIRRHTYAYTKCLGWFKPNR